MSSFSNSTVVHNPNKTASDCSASKEIPYQIDFLRGEVTALKSIAETLEERLEPVLHGGSPETDPNPTTPTAPCTLLGQEITDLRDTVRRVSRGLHDLVDRLEI